MFSNREMLARKIYRVFTTLHKKHMLEIFWLNFVVYYCLSKDITLECLYVLYWIFQDSKGIIPGVGILQQILQCVGKIFHILCRQVQIIQSCADKIFALWKRGSPHAIALPPPSVLSYVILDNFRFISK